MALFEEIREILVRELALPPELIKPDSKLTEDLGADSLDAMEIITALDERFGIDIPMEETIKIKTVMDITELVNQKLQAKPNEKP